ncbi:MAG: hypothetical protein R2788_01410 [Saprospiraceae bacterium]
MQRHFHTSPSHPSKQKVGWLTGENWANMTSTPIVANLDPQEWPYPRDYRSGRDSRSSHCSQHLQNPYLPRGWFKCFLTKHFGNT